MYDSGADQGITYLAMRYLRGGTLKEVLARSGTLPGFGDAARIVSQVSSALDYAHAQGIIHRDVKPSNILIDANGDAYLTDFGIAKVLEGTSHLTATGGALGTPAYMSPEQGLGRAVDARSDVYSLGIVLYEMLTGCTPFQADTPLAILLAHEREPLPLPSDLNPDIPEEVERILFKALAKNPADRYQSAGSMAVAFEQAMAALGQAQTTASPELVEVSAALANTRPGDEVTRDVRVVARRRVPRSQTWATGVAVAVLGVVAVIAVLALNTFSAARQAHASQQTAAAILNMPTATLDVTQVLALAAQATSTAWAGRSATQHVEATERALTPTTTSIPSLTPTSDPAAAFAYPILLYLQEQPLSFEDDFSVPGSWNINFTPHVREVVM